MATGVRRAGVERLAPMESVLIKVRDSGPYRITGRITLTDADGNVYSLDGEDVVLCRCGGSQTKPFCDGSHRENGFRAAERAVSAGTGEE